VPLVKNRRLRTSASTSGVSRPTSVAGPDPVRGVAVS
jgi:hypothetical protein